MKTDFFSSNFLGYFFQLLKPFDNVGWTGLYINKVAKVVLFYLWVYSSLNFSDFMVYNVSFIHVSGPWDHVWTHFDAIHWLLVAAIDNGYRDWLVQWKTKNSPQNL